MSSVEVTALIKSIQEEGQNTSSSDVSAINEPEECETDTSCTGGKQILHKKDLVVKLLANLENESDIIFDFTSLKACLNPTNIEDTDEEARDLDDTDNNNNVIVVIMIVIVERSGCIVINLNFTCRDLII